MLPEREHATSEPIVLPVETGRKGLELVEELARRGFAATLVNDPDGWGVEIPPQVDQRVRLFEAVSRALAGSTR